MLLQAKNLSVSANNLGADLFYLANGFNLYIIIDIIMLAFSLTFIIGISYFWNSNFFLKIHWEHST